jgi:cytochrome c biogenesis protein CcdA
MNIRSVNGKVLIFLFVLIFFSSSFVLAENSCAVYITGVGCPHCARADPVVLVDVLRENPNFVVIEYEIYQQRENANLIIEYDNKYESGLGIPLIIFENGHLVGDRTIIDGIEEKVEEESNCPLLNGFVDFEVLDLNSLPNKPKIWREQRILIKKSSFGDSQILKDLLVSENISSVIENIDYEIVEPEKIALSGKSVEFENAIKLDGWIFQWDGEPYLSGGVVVNDDDPENGDNLNNELTFTKLISLAAVDAVNPCALAVLTLMLIAILTYNPKNRRNLLLAGLAFTLSVFIMYLIYGLIIIKFFQIVQALTSVRLWLYKILGVAAIILGFLNVKDFLKYKPGSIGTEMPMSMRPKLKKLISKVTSPKGAFVVGLFVTVFLLPCTIGPYVIAGGILSALEIIKTIPPLLLYNLIFVIPMLVITFFVYKGIAKVEDVSGWKEKNIKYLHLIAGIIMFLLGLAMFFGWV